MAESRYQSKNPVRRRRPVEVEGAPEEEDVEVADVARRVGLDPDEQGNRTDEATEQGRQSRAGRRPRDERGSVPIADDDWPEDR